MYHEHFGLSGPPFEFPPTPAGLFMSRQYREALFALERGVVLEASEFSLLVGESGTGKTILVTALIKAVLRRTYTAYIANPRLKLEEIIRLILHQLGTEPRGSSRRDLWRSFGGVIAELKAGDRVVVIIDDAQDLSDEALDGLRFLSNCDPLRSKRLHFILVAHLKLLSRLQSAALCNFNQRIGARAKLEALKFGEALDYVDYLLRQKGGSAKKIFDARALRYIIRQCAGNPRQINLMCHNAMLAAYDEGVRCVTLSTVRTALGELQNVDHRSRTPPAQFLRAGAILGTGTWATIALAVCLTVSAAIFYVPHARDSSQRKPRFIESAAIVNWGALGRGARSETPDGTPFVTPTFRPQTSKTLTSTDFVLPGTALASAPSANSLTYTQERKLSYEIRRAKSSLAAKRYTNAIYHLKRGLLLDPGNSDMRYLLELAQVARSQPEKSAEVMPASSARSVAAAGSLQSPEMPSGAPFPDAPVANLKFARPVSISETISPTNGAGPPSSVPEKVSADSAAASHTISTPHLRAVRHTSFAIQIDATMDQKNADQMVGRLQQLGYHPQLVSVRVGGQPCYKVEIGPYTSKDDATAADAELRLKYSKIFGGEAESPTTG
jgi:type II secretory pathway predicted ATPase ExeA/cell division septation protein DedD